MPMAVLRFGAAEIIQICGVVVYYRDSEKLGTKTPKHYICTPTDEFT
jgi:hypothetical protein